MVAVPPSGAAQPRPGVGARVRGHVWGRQWVVGRTRGLRRQAGGEESSKKRREERCGKPGRRGTEASRGRADGAVGGPEEEAGGVLGGPLGSPRSRGRQFEGGGASASVHTPSERPGERRRRLRPSTVSCALTDVVSLEVLVYSSHASLTARVLCPDLPLLQLCPHKQRGHGLPHSAPSGPLQETEAPPSTVGRAGPGVSASQMRGRERARPGVP